MSNDLIWVRCSGCDYRYKAVKGGFNVGYYHDHLNSITNGRGLIVKEKIKDTSTCKNCQRVIHLSSTGDWFHEITDDPNEITGEIECPGFTNPVATPKVKR
jgi:hypothetical protein